jgi:hypothetical protein
MFYRASTSLLPWYGKLVSMKRKNKDGTSKTRRGLWIVVAVSAIFIGFGIVFTFFSIDVIPQGEGPYVTALIGGGEAENNGVTLQIGNYDIVAGIPQYAGANSNTIQAACLSASQVAKNKKSTQDTLPLTVDPIGVTVCLANGQGFDADHGRLTVQVEKIGVIQAKTASNYLPLSKISAQIRKTTLETTVDTLSLLLLGVGTGLAAGACIGLVQTRKTEAREEAATREVNDELAKREQHERATREAEEAAKREAEQRAAREAAKPSDVQ